MLEIKNLTIEIEGKIIIKNLNLNLEEGKIHALMGPNGSGKSTLANTLVGNPKYKITSGEILINNKNITELAPNKRAQLGLFLSFQYPQEIEGVTISNFLRLAYNSLKGKKTSIFKFKNILEEKAKELGVDEKFFERYLNQGFSGGEKKKSEILQMLVLDPNIAILDETDSGLDIDALRTISDGIKKFMTQNKTCLIITHYKRILDHINPDKIFVMKEGQIIKEGGIELAESLEKHGYKKI